MPWHRSPTDGLRGHGNEKHKLLWATLRAHSTDRAVPTQTISSHRSLGSIEADTLAVGVGRRLQQLADGFEHRGDALVVRSELLLELDNPVGKLRVIHQQLAHPNEGPHDRDVDLCRPRRSQHARQHGDSLLGETKAWLAPTTPT